MAKITRKWIQSPFSPSKLFIPRPYQHFKLFMPYQYNQTVFSILSRNPEAIKSLEVFCQQRMAVPLNEKYYLTPKEFAKFLPDPELGDAAIEKLYQVTEDVLQNRDFEVEKLELKNLKSLSVFRDHQFLKFIQGFQLKVFRTEKSTQRDLFMFLETQKELEELHMDESASTDLFLKVKMGFRSFLNSL